MRANGLQSAIELGSGAHVHVTAQNQRSTICVAPDLYLESGSLHLCPRTQTCRMTSTCLQCRSLTLRQIGTRPRVAAHDVVVDVKEHVEAGSSARSLCVAKQQW